MCKTSPMFLQEHSRQLPSLCEREATSDGLEVKKCSRRNIPRLGGSVAQVHYFLCRTGPLSREWTKCSCRNIVQNSIAHESGFGFAERSYGHIRSKIPLRLAGTPTLWRPMIQNWTCNRCCAPLLTILVTAIRVAVHPFTSPKALSSGAASLPALTELGSRLAPKRYIRTTCCLVGSRDLAGSSAWASGYEQDAGTGLGDRGWLGPDQVGKSRAGLGFLCRADQECQATSRRD
jgi:hypothetical protein